MRCHTSCFFKNERLLIFCCTISIRNIVYFHRHFSLLLHIDCGWWMPSYTIEYWTRIQPAELQTDERKNPHNSEAGTLRTNTNANCLHTHFDCMWCTFMCICNCTATATERSHPSAYFKNNFVHIGHCSDISNILGIFYKIQCEHAATEIISWNWMIGQELNGFPQNV